MKNVFIYFLALLLISGCSQSKKELFNETDSFVKSLETTYESYGILGGADDAKVTKDEVYKITPMGRLINVKIQKVVNDDEYEDLRADLEKHYKGDKRVNEVYICKGGTVMIDCRN